MLKPALSIFLAAGICVWVAQAASQDDPMAKPVTLGIKAASTPIVLGELEKQTGVTLRTGASTAQDILSVHIDQAPLNETLKRIAQASGAQWEKMDNGYRLVRSETLARQQLAAENLERAKLYDAVIKRLSSSAGEIQQTFGEADARADADRMREAIRQSGEAMRSGGSFARMGQTNIHSPAGRALVSMLSMIGALEIANIGPSSRVVYATGPTQMQRPLSPKALELAQRVAEQQRVFEASSERGGTPEGPIVIMPGRERGGPRTPAGAPVKVIVVASRNSSEDQITLNMIASDSEGRTSVQSMLAVAPEPPQFEPVAPGKGAAVAWSAEAKVFSTLLKSNPRMGTLMFGDGDSMIMVSGRATAEPPKAELPQGTMRDRILSPERWEPLAALPGEAIQQWASSGKHQVVALLADEAFAECGRSLDKEPLTVDQLPSLFPRWGIKFTNDGSWQVGVPVRPASARLERIDRIEMGKMLRTLASVGRLTLDQRAGYVAGQPESWSNQSLDALMADWIVPRASDLEFGGGGGGQRDILRLWGSFSSGQRSTLVAGNPIPYSNMLANQQKHVRKMVFDSLDGPRTEAGPEMGGRGGPRAMPPAARGILSERTQLLPNGIPNGARLVLSASQVPAVLATGENGIPRYLDARAMATNQMLLDNGARDPRFGGVQYSRYQMAVQTDLNFRMLLLPALSQSRTLSDQSLVSGGGTAMAWEQLPPQFRKQMEDGMQRFRNGNRIEVRVGAPSERRAVP